MNYFYILDERGQAVALTDHVAWGEWMVDFENHRRVALTEIDAYRVSTVFLGIDHGFGDRRLLFETMAWEELADGSHRWLDSQMRYETIEAARAGHQEVVERLQYALAQPWLPYSELEDE